MISSIDNGNRDNCGSIIYEIATGLCHAHEKGVIHRDLKPENVLYFKDDDGSKYVAISDFGIGRFIDRDTTSITKSGIFIGTIIYAAPEQLVDVKNVDERADIYALGKIFYELLTGDKPYPSLDLTKLPSKYVYIISTCCNNDPDRRYHSVRELVQDLDSLADETGLLTKPAELIREEIQGILSERDIKPEKISKIKRLLLENTDNSDVLLRVFPSLMVGVLRKLMNDFPSDFVNLFEIYDAAISDGLSFEYCDSVANFYEKVFFITDIREIRIIILRRLPLLGYNHNRWHVGKTFASIVGRIEDPSLIPEVVRILRSDKSMADWCKEYLIEEELPVQIRNAI